MTAQRAARRGRGPAVRRFCALPAGAGEVLGRVEYEFESPGDDTSSHRDFSARKEHFPVAVRLVPDL
jgi:hypothetical protein